MISKSSVQLALNEGEREVRDEELMEGLDEINEEYGRLSLWLAASGFERNWSIKWENLT